MDKSSLLFLGLLALLVTCACIAGCSDSSSPAGTSGQAAVTTTTASSSALYAAGDIIKNPKSTGAAVLIISYDPGTDDYVRAYIYPNSDGSWGHRTDSSTVKVSRSIIEQMYTKKVGNVAVSAVPIGTPTIAKTPAATYTTQTASVTTTATTTVLPPPRVTGITPLTGHAGTTVSITELDGRDFRSGANVSLVKSGQSSISATAVSVTSPTIITCTFVIPSGAATGFWGVLVTNPDGQYHQYQNGFDILEGSTTATTTTTTGTTAPAGNVTLISLSPTAVHTGGGQATSQITVVGTNLGSGKNIILTKSGSTVTGTGYYPLNSQQAQAVFSIPSGSAGTWTVSVVDASGNVLSSITDGLTID